MEDLKFDFLFGQFVLNVDMIPECHIDKFVKLQELSKSLLDLFPKRRNEISNFVLTCLTDLYREFCVSSFRQMTDVPSDLNNVH